MTPPSSPRPGCNIQFAFSLHDRVIVAEVQRPGRVEALTVDFLGVQYRVSYWDNSERKTVWLHADELQPR